jgi:hypothetical protein
MATTIKTVKISRITGEVISESYRQVEGDYNVLDEIAKTLAEAFLKERREKCDQRQPDSTF